MTEVTWFYALTLDGDERHIYNTLPSQPGYLPPDGLAMCGKLVRYLIRSQPWAEHIPACRLCNTRSSTLPGRNAPGGDR